MEKFILSSNANTPKDYIKELYAAAGVLSDDAVCEGIQEVTNKRIDEIRNTKTEVEISGKSYYVSGLGDDGNDGTTPETAWKTLAKVSEAELAEGDGVFFHREEVFRGQLITKPGVTYSAYGTGIKPRLYGWYKNSALTTLWLETDVPDVWEYAEQCEFDVGCIVFDNKSWARKVYRSAKYEDGKRYDYRTKAVFEDYHDLTEDMSFFHDKETGKIYLRCERGNPGALAGDIEMSKREPVIRNHSNANVTIDNLTIGYANFGIASGTCTGLTVTNCEIYWIGGSIQSEVKEGEERKYPIPYGNGIEIYGGAYDFTVDNCYFLQNYDAAVTHQCGVRGSGINYRNVRYTNNVMEKCVYSVEIFLGDSELGEQRTNEDTYVENNIMRKGGGFGHSQRIDPGCTSLIRNGKIIENTKNYIVRNNIFDRSAGRLIRASMRNDEDGGNKAQYFDNLFVQKKGEQYCERKCKVYYMTENLPQEIAETDSEHGSKYIIAEEFGF